MSKTRVHPRPFRAEHVGSLLRPESLKQKRLALEAANKTVNDIRGDSYMRKVEDEAIQEVVRLQQELGFRAVTDGEYRRRDFWGPIFYNLKGFEELKVENPAELLRPYVPDSVCWSKFPPLAPRLVKSPACYAPVLIGR